MAKREHRRTNEATRASTLQSLEIAKVRALERGDVAAAIRAIELQGRILGMFGKSSDRAPQQSVDEALIADLAVNDAGLAAILRTHLERRSTRA